MDESRGPPQRRGAARETALRLTARQPYRRGAKSAGYGAPGGGVTGTVAASLPLTFAIRP
ncbi:hypothetical protein [Citrobacter sp. A316]|uniref:hypothetical protein n=1 Tax=Citrobacter sp. A316 TaxID=1639132 RepID=UPI0015571670|nr:hypothetical protein [Citrobacter sp. A316]